MNSIIEKVIAAKNLLVEAETELIETKGFCPYELGFCIRNIDDAIQALDVE